MGEVEKCYLPIPHPSYGENMKYSIETLYLPPETEVLVLEAEDIDEVGILKDLCNSLNDFDGLRFIKFGTRVKIYNDKPR